MSLRLRLHPLLCLLLLLALLGISERKSWAEAAPCAHLPPAELKELVLQGFHMLQYDERTQARLLFTHAVERLECLDAVVSPQLLAHVWLGLGAVRLRLKDGEGARDALTRALLIHPEARWNTELGSRGAQLLEEQRAHLQARARVRWRSPRMPRGQELFLDGRQVEDRVLWLAPGPHLLQVRSGRQILHSQWWDPQTLLGG